MLHLSNLVQGHFKLEWFSQPVNSLQSLGRNFLDLVPPLVYFLQNVKINLFLTKENSTLEIITCVNNHNKEGNMLGNKISGKLETVKLQD